MSEKIYDAGGAINSGVHQEEFGFERWTFLLTTTAIEGMLQKGERIGDPEYIKELPGRYWMKDSRIPTRYEIAEMKAEALSGGRAQVTVLIRRGHWIVSEFLRSHESVSVQKHEERVLIACSCHGEVKELPLSSFPEVPK